jgi:signal transduction histidine kinase
MPSNFYKKSLDRWTEKFLALVPPYTLLLVSLGATAFVTNLTFYAARHENTQQFDRLAHQALSTIEMRMRTYEDALIHARGLFMVEPNVTRAQFHTFTDSLNLAIEYPGIRSLGYIEHIPAKDFKKTVAHIRRTDLPNFKVWPENPAREDYEVVLYRETLDNSGAHSLGYDMGFEQTRRESLDRARDTGQATLSHRIATLVQNQKEDPQKAFLLIVPIYRPGARVDTIAERRAAIKGFVYSPFLTKELFKHIVDDFSKGEQVLGIDVYDNKPDDATPELLYSSTERPQSAHKTKSEPFVERSEITVAGVPWVIVVSALPSLMLDSTERSPWLVLVAGLIISLLLFRLGRAYEAYIKALRGSEALHRKNAIENERLYIESRNINRAKDEFLATLSHELRTPLTVIQGHSELLKSRAVRPMKEKDVDESIDAIYRNAQAQTRIVSDLLDVSSIITGKVVLRPQSMRAAESIFAAAQSLKLAADAKEIQLEIDLQDTELAQVYGDPTRLQQVLWNLISNAIKFTPRGGSIWISGQPLRTEYEISVRDSGQGIDPDFLPYVFDRFRQEDNSSTRRVGGLGLGLSIVRSLVETQGGSVAAKSAGRGKGSEFIIRLPLATAIQVSLPKIGKDLSQDQTIEDTPEISLKGARVLIIDDEPDACILVSRYLERAGAKTFLAASAAEGFTLYQKLHPQLIISDISMPGEDGYSLIRRIRLIEKAGGHPTPAIALTAFARDEDRRRALEAGYHLHIPKPVAQNTLVDAAFALLIN